MRPPYLLNIQLCYYVSKIVLEAPFRQEIRIQVEEPHGTSDGSLRDFPEKNANQIPLRETTKKGGSLVKKT